MHFVILKTVNENPSFVITLFQKLIVIYHFHLLQYLQLIAIFVFVEELLQDL